MLTGDRPTGQLHLGHLFGTLLNRVRLQEQGIDLMLVIPDSQTITDRDSPASLPKDVEELVADYLAIGIDPARATKQAPCVLGDEPERVGVFVSAGPGLSAQHMVLRFVEGVQLVDLRPDDRVLCFPGEHEAGLDL